MYKLFIDDERFPVGIFPSAKSFLSELSLNLFKKDFFGFSVISRNYTQTKNLIDLYGIPNFISFDHDLGESKNGYEIARYIIEQDLDGKHMIPSNFSFYVHSQNPIGKSNIENILLSYIAFKKGK